MVLQRFLYEGQRLFLVADPGDVALENLTFVVDGAPQVDQLTTQLHVHLIKVSAPLPEALHPPHPLPTDVGGEQRPKPVPPVPHRLAAEIDPALEQQVFDVAQRQRKPHLHHYHQADDLGRGVEVAERTGGFAGARQVPP